MLSGLLSIGQLLPIALIVVIVVCVFESCWRKCPPDKLMIVSGAGKMRSVSGKGTFVIPGFQRVDMLALGAVQVQLTTENDIPTQDAILIHACAVANFQIGQTPDLIETASKNYLNMDKEEMTRQVTEVMLGKMREVIGQMDLKELMRDRESFNAKVFDGSKDDLANLGLELRTFNVQDFSDSQGIIRSMGADQAAEADLYKRTKQAEAARIERQNQSDAELYSAQKDAEGIKAKATAEAEATRLKGEADGASEKCRGEGIAAGVKAQAEAYNGMENPYLLANRYIDIMPKVAEEVAKPLTAVDSIKMYGSGNAQKLVKETTTIVDQVASGLKDSTGVDLPSLLSGLLAKSDMDAGSAESLAD